MEIVDPESGGGAISLDDDDLHSAPIRGPILSEQYLYKMGNKPHGYALIINNRKFIGMPERKGSDKDAEGMQTLLVKLGYKVAMGNDLSAAQMKDVLQRWAARDHSTCDSFVCVLLSHGEQGKIFGTDTDVDIEELLGLFRGNRCASLAGKPKLFFIQACRGTNFDEAVDHVDGVPNESALNTEGYEDEVDAKTRQTLPSEADFLIAYSVVPGYYSWRNSTNGSWFMQAVIDIFTKYYKQLDLITMLTIVNNSVATVESSTSDPRFNNKKQIPSCVNMLRKLVYFNSEAVKNHGIFG
ncbi:Caspase-7 [Trichoplax sp. H2]|nr:Caspase-7 [Trichoplax sp. H2]|eukprot:RDD44779.1 Caspase-7 [Trichoplax sp. H2]